jgi:predicted alpha-1,2-mannosidase
VRADARLHVLACLLVACAPPTSVDLDSAGDPDTAEADAQDTTDAADTGAGPPTWRVVDWVDPRISTGGIGFNVGSGVPGAQAPFGLVKVSPDTDGMYDGAAAYHCGGYHADDDLILGFSHTHLHGVGIPEYGNILVMPTRGALSADMTAEAAYRSPFDDTTEVASPGYYAVSLDASGVDAELTATTRAAQHRHTFPVGASDALMVLDLSHTVPDGEITDGVLTLSEDGQTIEGWVFNINAFSERYGGLPIYFSARFAEPPTAWATWAEDDFAQGVIDRKGPDLGALFAFDLPEGGTVELQVGVSFTSVDAARQNLDAELPGWDFDQTHQATEDTWEALLSTVRYEGGTDEQRTIMATALYHSLVMPTVFDDADGTYVGFDGALHTSEGFTYFTDFSLWDTYRTQHPLLMLLYPDLQLDMVRSLMAMADQGGYLPKWPQGRGYSNVMVGTPADIVVAESYLKGITDFDADAALAVMRTVAEAPTPPDSPYEGRVGIAGYLEHGYVPGDLAGGSVARTQELCVADQAISNLAQALGDAETAAVYAERALGFQHLWDAETQFFRGRNADGSWRTLQEGGWGPDYIEGNAWQYLWMVPHAGEALVQLFGSPEAMVDKLSVFFERGKEDIDAIAAAGDDLIPESLLPLEDYWHSNEPDIHAAYLFLHAGRPDLAQEWVRWIGDALYSAAPDGIPGNDDAGTLSAWYVFSAMGLLPISGTDRYWIGVPFFESVTAELPGGTLRVEAPGASPDRFYVEALTVDGEPWPEPQIDHATLAAGAHLVFTLSDTPGDWGAPQ